MELSGSSLLGEGFVPPTHHPSQRALERFLRGELPGAEALAVVRHLLHGCPQCVQVTGRLWGLGEWDPADKALLAEMRRRWLARRELAAAGEERCQG